MKTRRCWVALVTLAGLSAGPAGAQPAAAPSVRLDAAFEAAWQRAVAAREAEGRADRAVAERAAAASPWPSPPALHASHRSDRWQSNVGQRESEIGVAIPLWLPGQRAARLAAADASVSQADAGRRAMRLQLAGELRDAAWTVVARQAELEESSAQAALLARLAEDVERRVGAGDLARADALAARAEHLASGAENAEVQQRRQAARLRWLNLTGLDAFPDAAALAERTVPTSPDIPIDHPELEHAMQSTEAARRRLESLRRSRREPPELSVGVRHDVEGRAEPSRNSLVVGVRIPFGSDGRYGPLEAAVAGELAVAQTNEQRLRERLQADLDAARSALSSAQAQLDAEAARAGLLRERAMLVERSFRAGETPLPELLRALAAASRAEGAAARQRAGLGLARARLHQALGLLP